MPIPTFDMEESSLSDLFGAFDPEDLDEIMTRPDKFAEALLLAPPNGKPFKANYVQTQILGSPHRYNVIRVHRRAGKSWSMAVLSLFYCFTMESCQILIVCPTQKQVAELFTTLRDFIRVNSWIQDYVVADSKSPQTLQFSNGSRVNGLTTGAKQNSKALSTRGQGADIILIDEAAFLNDGDWQALKPIMVGDRYRRFKPKVYAASTPAFTRGVYYSICKDPEKSKHWNEIHVSLLENPDLTEADVAEAKAQCSSELEWVMEWLAEFPDIGEGVFPKQFVDEARTPHIRYNEILKAVKDQGRRTDIPTRTMGVDWDKYNKDGHGPNIVIVEALPNRRVRLIYREEIPQSRFSLHRAVERIIELNDIFRPEWIYVDRGYGEHQIEELQLYGKRDRSSGLARKVVGVQFAELVEDPLPMGGIIKKRFKQAMVSLLRKMFEEGRLEIAEEDYQLYNDLLGYHIVGKTEQGLKFSDENEHAIDALGLASMAMHQRVTRPYAPPPATKTYSLPMPEAVPAKQVPGATGRGRTTLGRIYPDPGQGTRSFTRSALGSSPPSPRSKF